MGYMQLMQRVAEGRASEPSGRGLARRDFIKLSIGSGFALGIAPLTGPAGAQQPPAAAGLKPFQMPAAFVAIARDGTVTVQVNRLDMGQGTETGLAMVLAEELDADWSKVRATPAPLGTAYVDPAFGMMLTGGSTALKHSYLQYRELGARARAMLVAAAAAQWNVPTAEIKVASGVVSGGGKSAGFGELAEAAWKLPVPEKVALKDPKDFRLIGQPVMRLATPDASRGAKTFGIDIALPGMKTVVLAHAPVFGAKVASLRCGQGARHQGRDRGVEDRRAGPRRPGGGRDRRRLLAREARPRRAGRALEQRRAREGRHRPADGPVPHAGAAAGPEGKQGRAKRAGRGAGGSADQDRRRVRLPVPRPFGDGADELHDRLRRQSLPDVVRAADAPGRCRNGGCRAGPQARDDRDHLAAHRGRVRPTCGARRRLCARSRSGGQGLARRRQERAAADHLEPRGRHARRLLPAVHGTPRGDRAGCRRQGGRVEAHDRQPVDRQGLAVRAVPGQGRGRRDDDRRGRRHALRSPGGARGAPSFGQRAGAVVAQRRLTRTPRM